jgi:hypothetical protein
MRAARLFPLPELALAKDLAVHIEFQAMPTGTSGAFRERT